LGVAQTLAAGRIQFPDQVCFHAQQAVEKYVKALLQERGIPFPRTHDVLVLLNLLVPLHPKLRRLRRGSRTLTRYAVDYRYPGLSTTGRQARSAVNRALVFRAEIRKLLGLRPRT
jgi:HEPN domain-containing protein